MNKTVPRNFNEVVEILNQFIEEKKLRKTPERFYILEEIYSRDDHFEAEMLYNDIIKKKFNLSKATVYNTLELFIECKLIKKHQFGNNFAQYEKSYGYKQHDHLICIECNKVFEFCDPRIQNIKQTMGDIMHFKVMNHSLTLYAHCDKKECKT